MTTISHILFPFDFSPQGHRVAPLVRTLALRLNARVTLLAVAPTAWEVPPEGMRPLHGNGPDEWKRDLQAQLDAVLTSELEGVRVERVADAGDAAMRIEAFANHHHVDLVMMPTRGRGVFRELLLGSVASKVLHDVTCPVWTNAHVEAEASPEAPRRIVCALDGGSHTADVCRWAADFSAAVGGTLRLLHVAPLVSDWSELASERRLQEDVRKAADDGLRALLAKAGVTAPLDVVVGDVGVAVAEFVRLEKMDMVIAGRGAINEAFGRMRAHTFSIVQRSTCPVISV